MGGGAPARLSLIVYQPLSNQVFVVFDVFIKPFELPNLKGQYGQQYDHHEQEWIDSPLHQCLHLWLHSQQWCEAFRDGVGNTQRQQQETNDRSSQPPHDEVKVDVSDAVGVHLLNDCFEPPLGAHQRYGSNDFRMEDTQGPILPRVEERRLVQRDSERSNDDQVEQQTQEQRNHSS